MVASERKLNASLHQIVADRNLSAKGIASSSRIQLVQVVGVGLDEYGNIEVRKL